MIDLYCGSRRMRGLISMASANSMKSPSSYHRLFQAISPRFRARRMRRFLDVLAPTPDATILDVGGNYGTWIGTALRCRITLLNIHKIPPQTLPAGLQIETVIGDGCDLQFADRTFDIVFSNSVIEHVGSFERQRTFARECCRVGRQLWIQTPARSFPIEPHFVAPFIHFLPHSAQLRLARRFTLWGLLARPSPAQIDALLRELRLLTYPEMRELFPDSEIIREKMFGLTKSYIAIQR
jgi:hypothetical protein